MYALSDQTAGWKRPEQLEKFRKETNDIFNAVKDNKILEGEKGIQDIYEFVAELANPIFRQKLQSIDERKWYTKILDAFKSLLGIHSSSTYYNRMMNALDNAIEAFDIDGYMEYNGMKSQLQQAYNEHRVDLEKMSESELKDMLEKTINKEDARLKEKEVPTVERLKPQYRGKLIYAQSGTGKSTIADNVTVFDGDYLLGEVLGVSPETAGFFFGQMSAEQKKTFGQKYRDLIRQKIAEGKTVLTANASMLNEADVVVYNKSAEQTESRANSSNRAKTNQYSALDYHKNTLETIKNLKENEKNKEYIELDEKSYLANHILSSVDSTVSNNRDDKRTASDRIHNHGIDNSRLAERTGVDRPRGLNQREFLDNFLKEFGITVKHLEDYDGKLPLFDALHRVINAKSADDITDGVGYAVAFMMQADPEMQNIIHLAHGWNRVDSDKMFPVWLAKTISFFGLRKLGWIDGKNAKKAYLFKNAIVKGVGNQIAQELRNHFGEPFEEIKIDKENRSIWQIIKNFFLKVSRVIPFFRNMQNSGKKRDILVADLIDALGREDFSRIKRPLVKPDTTEKAIKVDIEPALRDSPYEEEIISKLGKHGIALAGSASIALEGSLYRPAENPFHDIDFATPDNTSKKDLDTILPQIFGENRVHFASRIWKLFGGNTYTYVTLDRPFVVKNPGKGGKTEYYDLEGNYLGRRVSYSELELEPGVKGKLLDFFTGAKSESAYGFYKAKLNGKEYLVSHSDAAMAAKVLWTRPKDVWDYNHFKPKDYVPTDISSFINSMSKDQLMSELKQIKREYADYALVQSKEQTPKGKSTFTFDDGETVNTPFKLNDQQAEALNTLDNFLKSDEKTITLAGYAGTGKTSLMEILANKAKKDRRHLVFSATTNKAAAVLNSKVSALGYTAHTAATVFGITLEFEGDSKGQKQVIYDVRNLVTKVGESNFISPGMAVVIDEASMIGEQHYQIFKDIAEQYNIKIIFVGDKAQLPPVGEDYISKVFRNADGKVLELTKVERTGDNAILKEATNIRNGGELSQKSSFNKEGKGVAYLNPKGEHRQDIEETVTFMMEKAKKGFDFFKILAFTNKKVSQYNNWVRQKLGYGSTPEVGESIMAYTNWGRDWRTKTYKFVNSQEYRITKVGSPVMKTIQIADKAFNATFLPISLVDTQGKIVALEFLDVKNNEANRQVALYLATIRKALWGKVTELKRQGAGNHALKPYYQKIGEIDKFLFINDFIFNEKRECLAVKTFDYGYAITIHKSQGSTFTHVLVDANDIATASDKKIRSTEDSDSDNLSIEDIIGTSDNADMISTESMNLDMLTKEDIVDTDNADMVEGESIDMGMLLGDSESTTESIPNPANSSQDFTFRQQLQYVAVSRATDTVTFISSEAITEDSVLNHINKGTIAEVKEEASIIETPTAPKQPEFSTSLDAASQQEITTQLVDHLKAIGITVKNRADIEKFMAEHPDEFIVESIFGIDNNYLNQDHLDVIPGIQKIIEGKKYNKAGTDVVKLEDDNKIYLIDHSTDEEYKVHRREGRHGVGIRKVFNLDTITKDDIKEIIRNVALGYDLSTDRVHHLLQTLGIEEGHMSGIDFDAEIRKAADAGTNAVHGKKGQGEGTRGYGPRGYNNNGSERGRTTQRPVGQSQERQLFVTPNGEVYGFINKDGEIYLDETKISPEHPIHEYTHLWDNIVIQKNLELWNRGKALMRELPLWNEILNDPNYGKKWQAMGIKDDRIEQLVASEVHARLVGESGKAILEKLAKDKGTSGIVAKLKQWLLDVYKHLKGTFTPWTEDELNKLTLKEFNRMTLRDFVQGTNPNAAKTALKDFTLHSGGAEGSDSYWGFMGRDYGIKINHYYREGSHTPEGNVPVSDAELAEANVHLQKANETLKRRFPTSNEYVNNLLRRNWNQVKNSDAIFAVSTIKDDIVSGGTGWAVQMAIDNNKPVYVFDQEKGKWYTFMDNSWVETETPTLTPEFAGIGTREINKAGKKAIEE